MYGFDAPEPKQEKNNDPEPAASISVANDTHPYTHARISSEHMHKETDKTHPAEAHRRARRVSSTAGHTTRLCPILGVLHVSSVSRHFRAQNTLILVVSHSTPTQGVVSRSG
ncbi:hypothetical protein JTB14_006647 [Gonioctena quinquepunctata]|nr:hypothetical protein JTB14_006647 [Gonioctena quinquepunctata]